MLDKALQLIAYLLFIGAVITMGWEEPLSQRFLPRQPQPQQGNNAAPRVEPQAQPLQTGLLRGSLDYGPYRVKKGVVEFVDLYDPNTLGNPTTTQHRHQIPAPPNDAASRPAQ
jgi:hypothetical protein